MIMNFIMLVYIPEFALGVIAFLVILYFSRSGSYDNGITEKQLKQMEMEEAEEKERQKWDKDYIESLMHVSDEELDSESSDTDSEENDPLINWEEESKKEKEKHTSPFYNEMLSNIWLSQQFDALSHSDKIKVFYKGGLWSRYEECGYVDECRMIVRCLFVRCRINPRTKEYFDFVTYDGTVIPEPTTEEAKKKQEEWLNQITLDQYTDDLPF